MSASVARFTNKFTVKFFMLRRIILILMDNNLIKSSDPSTC